MMRPARRFSAASASMDAAPCSSVASGVFVGREEAGRRRDGTEDLERRERWPIYRAPEVTVGINRARDLRGGFRAKWKLCPTICADG